ncbi:MAG: helix-turn-helix domain-containing protein [Prevotella sp.]|jgi:YesN/AraC family two-component response regulator
MALLFLLFAPQSGAMSYNQLLKLSNDSLYRKSQVFLDDEHKADSAMLLMSIIVSRNELQPRQAESRQTAVCLMQMGYLYVTISFDYVKAYNLLRRSRDICQRNHYDDILSYIYINLGLIDYLEGSIILPTYFSQKDVDYMRKGFELSVKEKQPENITLSFLNLMGIVLPSANQDKILKDAQAFKALPKSLRIYNREYIMHAAEGVIQLVKKNYAKAEQEFGAMTNRFTAFNTTDSIRYMYCSYASAAKACQMDGRYADAVKWLNKALAIVKQHHIMDEVIECYYFLYDNYKQMGNKELAHSYRYQYFEARDSFIRSSRLYRVRQEKFDADMNENNQRLKASIERQRKVEHAFVAALIVLVFIVALSLIIYKMYKKQREYAHSLYKKNVELMNLQHEKYSSSRLDESDKADLQQRIQTVMGDVATISSPEFSLQQLAEMVGSNSRYVSQVINERYDCNFRALLNDRRIKEACRRLSDSEHYGQLTIDAIATSVGFRSRSNFLNVFKKITGLSPSEFQKYAQNN